MPHLEDPYDRYRTQFQRIRDEFLHPRHPGEERVELVCDDLAAPRFAYERDRLVVRSDPADVRFLQEAFPGTTIGEEVFGTRLAHIGGREARETLGMLRQARGRRTGGLHHLLAVASDVNLCPADEPLPPQTAVEPPSAAGQAGDGVIVDVIDTGLVADYETVPWLASVGGQLRHKLGPGGDIPLDYGHGTFVTGVLRCVAPATTVRVSNALQRAGAITECGLRNALMAVLQSAPAPQIISLSAGGTSEDGQTMLGLEGVVREIHKRGIVLVAAAGNHGNTNRFFPAAFPGVVSVGALRQDRNGKACFSNSGDWVSVYAPGERLVNAFASGRYRVKHQRRDTCRFHQPGDTRWYPGCTCVTTLEKGTSITFGGIAQWSGTSFATPIVAALIASRLSAAGGTPRQAADWLLRHPAKTIPGLGPVVLPGQSLSSRCTGSDCEGDC